MILADRDIRAALQRHDNPLIVDPGFDPRRLQPASLELTLSADVLMHRAPWVSHRRDGGSNLHGATWDKQRLDEYPRSNLEPGGFWLGSTIETIHMPTDLTAQVNGKSSLARMGISIHQTGGFIDPGFRGQITLEIANVSKDGVWLEAGMPICQLVFFQMTSPAERPYGTDGLGSHYMGQQGPTSARV